MPTFESAKSFCIRIKLFSTLVIASAFILMPMGIALAEEEPVAIGPSRGYLYLMGWQDSLTPVGSGGGRALNGLILYYLK